MQGACQSCGTSSLSLQWTLQFQSAQCRSSLGYDRDLAVTYTQSCELCPTCWPLVLPEVSDVHNPQRVLEGALPLSCLGFMEKPLTSVFLGPLGSPCRPERGFEGRLEELKPPS